MKKLFSAFILLVLMLCMSVPALAYDYGFSSGSDITFGKSTGTDEPVAQNPETENIRRNKDAAYNPPPYGVFSGDIPTDPSSPYHDNLRTEGPSYSSGGDLTDPYASGFGTSDVSTGLLTSTSVYSGASYNTAPMYYDDGSIGTLSIPKLNKTIKVYEGESLENMKKGIGHFESTSVWDGNCALAGHNRGAAAYFSFVKNLAVGDKLTYTTKYGSRTYEVYNKVKISETDYSGLGWSADNILTLITCVEDEPAYRYLVQAREVK